MYDPGISIPKINDVQSSGFVSPDGFVEFAVSFY